MRVADAADRGIAISVGTTRVSRSPSPCSAAVAVVMLINATAGIVVSVAIEAIFSLVVLVQPQRHTTLLVPVCHGRRVSTPPCSMPVAPALLPSSTTANPFSAAAAVTLLAAAGAKFYDATAAIFSVVAAPIGTTHFLDSAIHAVPSSYVCVVFVLTLVRFFLPNVISRTPSVHPDYSS